MNSVRPLYSFVIVALLATAVAVPTWVQSYQAMSYARRASQSSAYNKETLAENTAALKQLRATLNELYESMLIRLESTCSPSTPRPARRAPPTDD